jgi:hypothetical protein
MSKELKANISNGAEISEIGMVKPSLHYYLDVPKIQDYAISTPQAISNTQSMALEDYKLIDSLADLDATIPSDKPYYMISRIGLAKYNTTSTKLTDIKHFGPYVLLGNQKAVDDWK